MFGILANAKYFQTNVGVDKKDHVSEWKSKGLPEIIKPPATTNNRLNPKLSFVDTKTRVEFNGSCLKQDKITYTHGTIVNIYIVYKLSSNLNNFDFALENCLFGAVKLTKNADIDKYRYSGYGIGFGARRTSSFPAGDFDQNVIIFGGDMSSSIHADNKKKNILILVEGPTQGLGDETLTAEKKYLINFTENRKKCYLNLHYNGTNS